MFKSKLLKIELEIDISCVKNIDKGISRYLDKFLLKHSTKLGGILVSYKILQISTRGMIVHANPNIFLTAHMDALVLDLPVGSRCTVSNGLVLGAFYSRVGDDTEFCGDIIIKNFSTCSNDITVIEGCKAPSGGD